VSSGTHCHGARPWPCTVGTQSCFTLLWGGQRPAKPTPLNCPLRRARPAPVHSLEMQVLQQQAAAHSSSSRSRAQGLCVPRGIAHGHLLLELFDLALIPNTLLYPNPNPNAHLRASRMASSCLSSLIWRSYRRRSRVGSLLSARVNSVGQNKEQRDGAFASVQEQHHRLLLYFGTRQSLRGISHMAQGAANQRH